MAFFVCFKYKDFLIHKFPCTLNSSSVLRGSVLWRTEPLVWLTLTNFYWDLSFKEAKYIQLVFLKPIGYFWSNITGLIGNKDVAE